MHEDLAESLFLPGSISNAAFDAPSAAKRIVEASGRLVAAFTGWSVFI